MKKKITYTLVLFVFGLVVNAQKQAGTFSRIDMANAMSLFVESVKPAYQKGQTYNQFEKVLIGTSKNTPNGNALLTKAYQYLAKGVSKEQIAQEYSGKEFANALATNNTLKKGSDTDGKDVFGGTVNDVNSFSEKGIATICKWYNLSCFMSAIKITETFN